MLMPITLLLPLGCLFISEAEIEARLAHSALDTGPVAVDDSLPSVRDSETDDSEGDTTLGVDTGTGGVDPDDQDGDGYTPAMGDCDDTRDDVWPGNDEVYGDGVDNDCNGLQDGLDACPAEGVLLEFWESLGCWQGGTVIIVRLGCLTNTSAEDTEDGVMTLYPEYPFDPAYTPAEDPVSPDGFGLWAWSPPPGAEYRTDVVEETLIIHSDQGDFIFPITMHTCW